MLEKPTPKFGIVEEGVIEQVNPPKDGGIMRIMVRCEAINPTELIVCKPVLTSSPELGGEEYNVPSVGARALILVKNIGKTTEGYFLGVLDTDGMSEIKTSDVDKINIENGGYFKSTPGGNKIYLSGDGEGASFLTNRSGFKANGDISIFNSTGTTFELRQGELIGKTYIGSLLNGEISFTGEESRIFSRKTFRIESSAPIRMKAIEWTSQVDGDIVIESKSLNIITGRLAELTAAGFSFHAVSRKLVGGPLPGLGSPVSFDVSVDQGNIAFTTTEGRILMHSIAPIGEIQISCGAFPFGNLLGGALLRVSTGVLDLKSSGVISIAALGVLDLQGTTTIFAPHIPVIPGPGPFNLIPVCPLTGIPHQSPFSATPPVDKYPAVIPPAYLV